MKNLWNAFALPGGAHMGTGREDLILLQSLIMANRPRTVIETGTYRGYGTICIAEALMDCPSRNHYLWTIEYKDSISQIAISNYHRCGIEQHPESSNIKVRFLTGDSGDPKYYQEFYAKYGEIDLAFIDCGNRLRAFEAMYPYLKEEAIVIVHDAWTRKASYSQWMDKLKESQKLYDYGIIPTERGMSIMRVRQLKNQ